jgi:quercetin dioxygenase-like cupin family protein
MLQRILTIGIALASIAAPQDPVKTSADSKAEIENDWVRVLRVKRGPHGKAPMRQHPASVVVFLTGYHQKLTGPEGQAQEIARKAGDVAFFEALKYSEENLSDQPLEAVMVELKPRPSDFNPAPITLDPVKLDPEHHLVPLENDRVRVLRTILEPHLKSPMHEHPHYLVVYLTELHTTMKLGDGRVVDNPRKPGEIAWRDALKHQTENIGDRTAMEIQVELK